MQFAEWIKLMCQHVQIEQIISLFKNIICIFCVPLGKRLMTTSLLLKVGRPKKMHCQFSKLLGNYYSYMTEEIKWWVSERYIQLDLVMLPLVFVNHIAAILCITQRFEKLCRAILASMEVENEPKVSLWMFDKLKCSFPLCYCECISPSGMVCFLGSLKRPHHSLAQTN